MQKIATKGLNLYDIQRNVTLTGSYKQVTLVPFNFSPYLKCIWVQVCCRTSIWVHAKRSFVQGTSNFDCRLWKDPRRTFINERIVGDIRATVFMYLQIVSKSSTFKKVYSHIFSRNSWRQSCVKTTFS